MIKNVPSEFTLDMLARAAVSNCLYSAAVGTTVSPENCLTYTYRRYPYTEAEMITAIYNQLDKVHTKNKKIEQIDGDYIVVKLAEQFSN